MGLTGVFAEMLHSLADFVFPPVCLVCGVSITDNRLLCPACHADIKRQSRDYVCEKDASDSFDGVSVLLPYDERCRGLIHGLKYDGFSRLGLELGSLIGEKARHECGIDGCHVVIPIPLHISRLRSRGYNQSERLARGFITIAGGVIAENVIVRTRDTGTQTKLDAENRAVNVKNAFAVRNPSEISGKTVVLIDDVMTTGSTLSECAGMLKNAGAAGVIACVAASPAVGHD